MDSTSGNEGALMHLLSDRLGALPGVHLVLSGDPGKSPYLFLSWGTPQVVFCTHVDTVPPYIPPTFHREDGSPCPPAEAYCIRGRGACDAKGQLLAMLTACERLAAEGCTDFGLLLVTGEETGSWGAKAFAQTAFRAPYLIVGEPTENKMVSASKGTKAFALTFRGEAFHSGYPQYGRSAVESFVAFYNALKQTDFGDDPLLGATTWNIGRLVSDNPQNILSPELTCRLYFRTTFASDEAVVRWMEEIPGQARNDGMGARNDRKAGWNDGKAGVSVEAIGGDTPARYFTLPGFDSAPVSFGSDAPHLTNFTHKAICGPGSITVAHRDDEHVRIADLETAVEQYLVLYRSVVE